jgi:hypothetical protein
MYAGVERTIKSQFRVFSSWESGKKWPDLLQHLAKFYMISNIVKHCKILAGCHNMVSQSSASWPSTTKYLSLPMWQVLVHVIEGRTGETIQHEEYLMLDVSADAEEVPGYIKTNAS